MPMAVALVRFSQQFICIPDDISKTDAARIGKLDIQMFHDESCRLTTSPNYEWAQEI